VDGSELTWALVDLDGHVRQPELPGQLGLVVTRRQRVMGHDRQGGSPSSRGDRPHVEVDDAVVAFSLDR